MRGTQLAGTLPRSHPRANILYVAPLLHCLVLILATDISRDSIAFCSSGRQLAAAFANISVTTVVIARDLALADSDWDDIPQPIALERNFTITSVPAGYILDLNAVRAKVRLGNGAVLNLTNVVLTGMRSKPLGVSPGADLLLPSLPNSSTTLAVQGGLIMMRYCYPPPISDQNYASLARSAQYPGTNLVRRGIPQNTCVADPSAPPLRRCWADVGFLGDLALDAVDVSGSDRHTPANYVVRVVNSMFACAAVLAAECIAQYGPLGCRLKTLGTPADPPPPPSMLVTTPGADSAGSAGRPLEVAAPPAQPRAGGGGEGGSLSGRTLAAAVLSSVLIGALILGVSAFAAWRWRRAPQKDGGAVAATAAAASQSDTRGTAVQHSLRPWAAAGAAHKPALPVNVAAGDEGEGKPQGDDAAGEARPITAGADDDGQITADVLDPNAPVSTLTPPRVDLHLGADCSNLLTLSSVTLGKGSFGQVVAGSFNGRPVAVKLLRHGGLLVEAPAQEDDAVHHRLLKMMTQEVEVLGRCRHPNVVQLIAANLGPPQPCLVMERMETSLDWLLYGGKTGELLPLPKLLHITAQIACGLDFLHPTILHRDLKPANVLIADATSPRPVVKLTDFGLSRLRDTVMTTKNPEVGTPSYMAPECFETTNYTITHKADVYALGVLVAEMLAGRMPWEGYDTLRIASLVNLYDRRPPLLEQLPSSRCPHKLHCLIEACWDRDPQRRPAAAEVAKNVQLLLLRMGAAATDTRSPSGPDAENTSGNSGNNSGEW